MRAIACNDMSLLCSDSQLQCQTDRNVVAIRGGLLRAPDVWRGRRQPHSPVHRGASCAHGHSRTQRDHTLFPASPGRPETTWLPPQDVIGQDHHSSRRRDGVCLPSQ